jgi:hypothetical protein
MLVSGKVNGMTIHVLLDTRASRSLISHQLARQHTWISKPVNETIAASYGVQYQIRWCLAVPLQLDDYPETLPL